MQFVEVSNIDSARILYPDIEPPSVFLGIVKSEPEKYTQYGMLEMTFVGLVHSEGVINKFFFLI